MGKKRICLAIGNKTVEDWMINNLSDNCDFVGTALHRGSVLSLINEKTPDILIFDVSLPTSKLEGISVDLLIHKIRTTYPACRIILICGQQNPGGEFLTRMVNKGVYDIVYGKSIQIQDVCDMIFIPKDYSYASKLQAFDDVSDKEIGVESAEIIEKSEVIQQVSAKPQRDYDDSENTTVLTASDNPFINSTLPAVPNIQGGIIFYPNYPQSSNSVVSGTVEDIYGYGSSVRNNTYGNQSGGNEVYYPQNYKSRGRVIVYASVREGVGCTSSAINTAYAFADLGKKVLVIDGNMSRSCIYQRLGLPETFGYTVQDVVRCYANGQDITNMPLSGSYLENSGTNSKICKNLFFLRTAENFNYNEDLPLLDEVINRFKRTYDFIIVDILLTNICYPIIGSFVECSDKTILVTLQDIYEINTAYYVVSSYRNILDTSKILVLVNRYIKEGDSLLILVTQIFHTSACISIPEDTYGYFVAYSSGRAYYLTAKKKTKQTYKSMMKLLS